MLELRLQYFGGRGGALSAYGGLNKAQHTAYSQIQRRTREIGGSVVGVYKNSETKQVYTKVLMPSGKTNYFQMFADGGFHSSFFAARNGTLKRIK